MTKFPLGALLNGEYCLPCNAEKGLDYICPGCKAPVILRRGEIKAPHFAHKPGERRCEFYDHPGEGEIHKMTKHIIADLLRKRKIRKIQRLCPMKDLCLSHDLGRFDEQVKYEKGDEVIVEYRVSDKCIVDVAVINNGKLKYIFEVYDTHKTARKTPEPWFEIDAKKFLKDTENGTKLTENVEYSLDVDDMTLLQVVEELNERGVDLGGTFYEKCDRLENERHISEYVHCIRMVTLCPQCKINASDFTAMRDDSPKPFISERMSGLRDRIISSKEYEECYPKIGAIDSILDHEGNLSVRVDGYKFEKSPNFIQRKFINMIKREWCEAEGEPLFDIDQRNSHRTLYTHMY
jgi:hypothetical protein